MDRLMHIMIVEDDVLLSQSLEIQISKTGHYVMGSFASFREVRQCSRLRGIDLALVDFNLGHGGTGNEVAAWLHEAYSTPIVFLTANPGRIDIRAPGTVGLIEKPYTYACLKLALDFLYRRLLLPPPRADCPPCLSLAPVYKKAWVTDHLPSVMKH